MYINLLIAGFVLIALYSHLKRVLKYFKLCPNNLKWIFGVWNLLMVGPWVFMGAYLVSLNKIFVYAFIGIFPLAGLLLVLFPKQYSELHHLMSGKLQTDKEYLQAIKTVGKIIPDTKNTNTEQMMNKYNSPVYIRMLGIFFVVFGMLFLFFIK